MPSNANGDGEIVQSCEQWPFLDTNARHPIKGYETAVFQIIWTLNDYSEWTREAIADWVATIEPPETPQETERTSLSAALDPVVGTQA